MRSVRYLASVVVCVHGLSVNSRVGLDRKQQPDVAQAAPAVAQPAPAVAQQPAAAQPAAPSPAVLPPATSSEDGALTPPGAVAPQAGAEKPPADTVKEEVADELGPHEGHNAGLRDSLSHVETGDNGVKKASGGQAVAVGLVATVLLVPWFLSYILEKKDRPVRAELAMTMLDTFVSIFLAVLWFNAFAHVMHHLTEGHHESQMLAHIVCFLVLYVLLLFLIRVTQKSDKLLTLAIAGCGGHYIGFASIQAGGAVQKMVYENKTEVIDGLPPHYSWVNFILIAALFMVCALLIYAGISLTGKITREQSGMSDKELDEHEEVIDELEVDIGAITFSYLITQGLRFCLTGHYPAHHLLLQAKATSEAAAIASEATSFLELNSESPDAKIDINVESSILSNITNSLSAIMHVEEVHHTAWQRHFMLVYAIVLSAIACVVLNPLHRLPHKYPTKRWLKKACELIRLTLVMCIAWGFLLFGEWEFLEHQFQGEELFGWMLLALIFTIVALLVIEVFSGVLERLDGNSHASTTTKNSMMLVAMALSFTTAWSWEHTFDMALDVFGHMYSFGQGGLIPKLLLAILIPFVMFPVYLKHVKATIVEFKDRDQHPTGSTNLQTVVSRGVGNYRSDI